MAHRKVGAGPLSFLAAEPMAHTEARCHALLGAKVHGARIGIVPGRAVPTGQLFASLDDVPPGCFGVLCHRCKTVTVYRVVANENEAA